MRSFTALLLATAALLFAGPASAAVTVGGLSYSIVSVSRETVVGPDMMPQHANGEFIVVKLTVRNVGKEAADINASDFHLKRGDTTYDATNNIMNQEMFFLAKVNPGTAKTGLVVFDVPANTAPSKYALEVYGNGNGERRSIALH